MALPTRYGRLAVGYLPGGTANYADVVQSWGCTLTSAVSSGKHIIQGIFEVLRAQVVIATAANASAKAVDFGTDATAARFGTATISAGAANEAFVITAASADILAWRTTGTAAAVTTVRFAITDTSAFAGTAYARVEYCIRG